ncbi:hypothetical protein [Aliikangiella sp. IMCC44359]|uniref:hypothetical protein n=1 Tax=Aliikangiella sp. IMCC44359 TaxID=3459125 RepID=UPI00403AA59D
MVEIGLYTLIFILSIAVIAVSVYAAGIEGNIVHLDNDREPSAGVSLFGYILFPIFFVGVAYIGNMLFYGLGWYISFGLFSLIFLYSTFTIPRRVKKYNALLKQRNSS